MATGNRSIVCTLATEDTDCPAPLACYEVKDATAGNVSYSFCACLVSYGYTGAQCDERSLATNLYLTFDVILFIILIVLLIPSSVIAVKAVRKAFEKRKSINQMVWVTLLTLLGITSFIIFLILTFVGIANPSKVSRFKGMRATYLWSVRQAFLFIIIFFAIVCAIFMSAIWYTTAMSTRKLREASHFTRVRHISTGYALSLMIVVVILFILELETALYIYLAICGTSVIIFLLYSSFVISGELAQFSSSEDSAFRKILENIRHVTLSTAGGITMAVLGAILSAVDTSSVSFRGAFLAPQTNAPAEFLYDVPVWVVGIIISLTGLAWSLIAILRYSATSILRDLTNKSNGISGSRNTSQVAAYAKTPDKLQDNNESTVRTLVTQVGAAD